MNTKLYTESELIQKGIINYTSTENNLTIYDIISIEPISDNDEDIGCVIRLNAVGNPDMSEKPINLLNVTCFRFKQLLINNMLSYRYSSRDKLCYIFKLADKVDKYFKTSVCDVCKTTLTIEFENCQLDQMCHMLVTCNKCGGKLYIF